jgi:hypothetical protein
MSGIFPDKINDDDIIVDPFLEKPTENTQIQLRSEVQDFEDIMALDYKYCIMVEGVSQESNLWVPRNQNETGLVDTDLQKFKNVTWNECVVRKFLTSEKGDVNTVGKSMINIIQALNLQWKNLQVMGVHPKIEAAEKQIIMRCFEENLFEFSLQIGVIARAFRRCVHFSDFFANAVGGYVCHNTGRTPGLSKTMYGADIDFAYREKNYIFFLNALRKRKDIIQKCIQHADNVDYVSRLTQLKIIKSMGPVVDLQDYDTGKPQQPMYVTTQGTSTGIDVGDIIRLLDSKIAKITERTSESRAEFHSSKRTYSHDDSERRFSSTIQAANSVIQQLGEFLQQFHNSDLQAIIAFQIQARDELFTILHYVHEMIEKLSRGDLSSIPSAPTPAPLPKIVDDFIKKRKISPSRVGNETMLTDNVQFTRMTRDNPNLQPLAQDPNLLNQM